MMMGGARRPWEEREQKEPEAAVSRFHSNTQQNLTAMHCNTPTLNSTKLREAPPPKKPCIFGYCPNCDLTPPIAQIRALCGTNFCPKVRNFFKQQF